MSQDGDGIGEVRGRRAMKIFIYHKNDFKMEADVIISHWRSRSMGIM